MVGYSTFGLILSGCIAGSITGLLGTGGGIVLVPLLRSPGKLTEDRIFPSSTAVLIPICLVSLGIGIRSAVIPWPEAVPYLAGSSVGGVMAGIFGKKIPVAWLHKALGILILWGGWRYLWH